MDLQLQRQTEFWLRLMGVSNITASNSVLFVREHNTYQLEHTKNRTQLYIFREVSEECSKIAILQLLNKVNPDFCSGIPMRTWITNGKIWISSSPPPYSGAEQWFSISNLQSKIFDRVLGCYDETY